MNNQKRGALHAMMREGEIIVNHKKMMWYVIAMISLAIVGGFGVGFMAGAYYQGKMQNKEVAKISKSTQYSVIDADHVLMNGDTVRYNWNKFARK